MATWRKEARGAAFFKSSRSLALELLLLPRNGSFQLILSNEKRPVTLIAKPQDGSVRAHRREFSIEAAGVVSKLSTLGGAFALLRFLPSHAFQGQSEGPLPPPPLPEAS